MFSKKEFKKKLLKGIPKKKAKVIIWLSNKITNFIRAIIIFSAMSWTFFKVYEKMGIDKTLIILLIVIILSLNKSRDFWN